jgi:transposase InsO family protein
LWDNAFAESFFASLRAELVDHERFVTRRAAINAIADYINNFYNAERRHSRLGYLSPSSSNCEHTFRSERHSQAVHGTGGSSLPS